MIKEVKIEGLENILINLRKKGVDIGVLLLESIDDGADVVVQKAQEKAPYLKGKIKAAIDKESPHLSGRFTGLFGASKDAVVDIGVSSKTRIFTKKDKWYARHQEIGTSKMKAQPYLRPAIDESEGEVRRIVANKLKRAL